MAVNPSNQKVEHVADLVAMSQDARTPGDRRHVYRFNAMQEALEFVRDELTHADVITAKRMARAALADLGYPESEDPRR